MNRCIMVLSPPRSGSSALAGALHRLGVNMGHNHLQQGNRWNERGYYEDLRWQRLNKMVTGERYDHRNPDSIPPELAEQFRRLATSCDYQPLWGMKDPRLCFTSKFIWDYLRDCRMISITRSPMAAAKSLKEHSEFNYDGKFRMTLEEASRIRDIWQSAMEDRIMEFKGAVLFLGYEALISEPGKSIDKIIEFVYDGLSVFPMESMRKAAIQFLDPKLRHH